MLSHDDRLKERYRILHKIGGGGFGNVYKAIDEVQLPGGLRGQGFVVETRPEGC